MSDENKVKRRYDIGNGVTIISDAWMIRAEWKPDKFSSHSIGIRRPPPKPDKSVTVRYSLGRKMFYLPVYCHIGIDGFWLGTKTWDSKEEMSAQQEQSIMGGKPGATFTPSQGPNAGKTYHREIYHFNMWNIKNEQPDVEVELDSLEGEMVKDYLALCQNTDKAEEARFNEDIKFTDWTLAEILKAIGPWEPVKDIPIVSLKKGG